jgi:hypothetical protein
MVSSPQNEGLSKWAGHAALTANRTSSRIVGGKCGRKINCNTSAKCKNNNIMYLKFSGGGLVRIHEAWEREQ